MDNEAVSTFSVILRPHRSLGPRGFAAVMTAVAAVSFVAGLVFVLIGAWPVFGFLGLDVLLLYWAFRRSYRDGERRETIDVTDGEVILRRLTPGKPVEELRFVRTWVRVALEEDLERELIGRLLIGSRGHAVEVGSFLAPGERKTLARALDAALARPRI